MARRVVDNFIHPNKQTNVKILIGLFVFVIIVILLIIGFKSGYFVYKADQPIPGVPGVTVSLSDDKEKVSLGEDVTYTLTVANNSPNTLHSAHVRIIAVNPEVPIKRADWEKIGVAAGLISGEKLKIDTTYFSGFRPFNFVRPPTPRTIISAKDIRSIFVEPAIYYNALAKRLIKSDPSFKTWETRCGFTLPKLDSKVRAGFKGPGGSLNEYFLAACHSNPMSSDINWGNQGGITIKSGETKTATFTRQASTDWTKEEIEKIKAQTADSPQKYELAVSASLWGSWAPGVSFKRQQIIAENFDTNFLVATLADEAILKLEKGFNLITIPYNVTPNEASKVLLGLKKKWGYKWDAVTQNWVNLFTAGVTLGPGEGFFVISDNGDEILNFKKTVREIQPATLPFEMGLAKGWNLAGNPSGRSYLDLSKIKVKSIDKAISLDEASKEGLISQVYIYDSSQEKWLILGGKQHGSVAFWPSWRGAFVFAKKDSLKLIFEDLSTETGDSSPPSLPTQ